MNNDENLIDFIPVKEKLYSSKAIGGATFLGGPLAAGYMIGENFKALNKPQQGRASLIVGILFTLVLLVSLVFIPDSIMNKIPNFLIPLIYLVIVKGIVDLLQGKDLKAHAENGHSFYSGWRAALIGFISFVIMVIIIFSYAYFILNINGLAEYDKGIDKFTKNETESVVFYEHLETNTNEQLLKELNETTIPKWKENIQIIKEISSIKGLNKELISQNKILLEYSQLRLEVFELYKKSIEQDTDVYLIQIQAIHERIDAVIKKLESNSIEK